MKDKRVVFMGTPEYSVPVLKMLIKETNVVGVVTQPDKYVGRKKVLTPCSVKKEALANNIPVLSLVKLREEYKDILALKPDIIITCAYGQILPEELIYAPRYNTINVHASLLPKYRGGAPIHHAIINGEKETGITIMFTDKGMDSGDIIKMESIPILDNVTYDIVSEKMSVLGAKLLLEVLPSIFNNTCDRMVQNHLDKTVAKIIKREDEHISFDKSAREVHNKIRGLSSIPGGYAILDGTSIKLLLSSLDDCKETILDNGCITRVDKNGIYVACNKEEVKIIKLQIPGKKPMLVRDYLNGVDKEKLISKKFD